MHGIKQQMAAISSGRWVLLIVGGSHHRLEPTKPVSITTFQENT